MIIDRVDGGFMQPSYFMIFLQPEEQLALKYILKNWAMYALSHQSAHVRINSQILDTYLDLAKDLDGDESDSFVLPLQRVGLFRNAMEIFYQKPSLLKEQAVIGAKHYEMLAKWFFEDKIAMTKDEILNLGSHHNIL